MGERGHGRADEVPLWMEVVNTRGGVLLLVLLVTGTAGILSGELGRGAQIVWACILGLAIVTGLAVHVRRVLKAREGRRAAGGPPGFFDELRRSIDSERDRPD